MSFSRRQMLSGGLGAVAGAGLVLAGCARRADPADQRTPERPRKRAVETGTITVPGAEIYYEVRGSGPPLLMIHAGSGEAGSFAAIAPLLAARGFRVVTYDRRGSSRSDLTGPPKDVPVALHADDALALLKELDTGRAHVFGSSAGAIVALDLAARFPDALRTIVSHEPPVFEVLPDPRPYRALAQDVYETYRKEGLEAGFRKFFGGQGGPPQEEETEPGVNTTPDPAMVRRSKGNDAFFLGHEMRALMGYRPDIDALKRVGARLVIGVGEAGAKDLVRVAETATARLGTDPVRFPGGHTGYGTHPKAFARRLVEVLNGGPR